METLTYDPCLLITKNGLFGIVGIQTNDTLILGSKEFIAQEDSELQKAKLLAKPIERLKAKTPLLFNSCTIAIADNRRDVLIT